MEVATASQDPESEAPIQQAINELIHGKTVAIAHRLYTVANATKIQKKQNCME